MRHVLMMLTRIYYQKILMMCNVFKGFVKIFSQSILIKFKKQINEYYKSSTVERTCHHDKEILYVKVFYLNFFITSKTINTVDNLRRFLLSMQIILLGGFLMNKRTNFSLRKN